MAYSKKVDLMQFKDRASIIEAPEVVDKVISFDDRDDSACGAIYKTLATHGLEPSYICKRWR